MGLVSLNYFEKALSYISERYPNPEVFVFSDDVEWCRQNMPWRVIGTGNRYFDHYLMRQCKHAIIANSSYSWWAAWLGDDQKDRIVIRPQKFYLNNWPESSLDICPERWVDLGIQ